jgi:hypothetical protein
MFPVREKFPAMKLARELMSGRAANNEIRAVRNSQEFANKNFETRARGPQCPAATGHSVHRIPPL